MRPALAVLPVLALAACGSTSPPHRAAAAETIRSYGSGATRVWVLQPAGRPRAVVVFLHGLYDKRETTPANHRPWLDHLVRRGVTVVYPAYEETPGQEGAIVHAIAALKTARAHIPAGLPVVEVGYSRGGRLVTTLAALWKQTGYRPRAVLSIFPAGAMDPEGSLAAIPHDARVEIMVGDDDHVVGTIGVTQLVTALARAHFPFDGIRLRTVHSSDGFDASHTSFMEVSPAARAAFWAPADRLIDAVAIRR